MKITIRGRVFEGALGELISNDDEVIKMLEKIYDDADIKDDAEREMRVISILA
jgi:hypothetical protein